jgi:hypothetical protein
VDFQRQKAVCPAGHESVEWVPRSDNRGNVFLTERVPRSVIEQAVAA